MDADELRRRWAATLGMDAADAGWPGVSPDVTCRPAYDPRTATTVTNATLSELRTQAGIAAGTLSAQGTLGGGGAMANASQTAADLGRFALGKELGRGGMGVVYRARQKSLQREVAIKLVRKELASQATQETFVAEALVNGHLNHPNIVPVHELGQDEQGQVFLAMKLVGGTSWKDLLHPASDEHRAIATGWTIGRHLAVLEAVANAVAFAHSKGIVHRDLKPENVMVGEFGEVLVMDWGIAVDIRDQPEGELRARHRSTVTAPAGTPSYMAPEQAEGRGTDLGPWTDTYLLGAILCEILTGAPPHRGATLMAVLMAASASRPPDLPASVPSGLAAICRKALARDHAERYRTVAELQQALREQARNRASEEVATRARATLERATTLEAVHARYSAYAEAIAGFRQALAMWADNPTAGADERRARLAYAAAARSAGDLGLAEVQLTGLGDGDDLAAERTALATERAAQAARARAARRNRVLLTVAVLAIIGGSLTASILINRERDKAVASERVARDQEQEAQRQKAAAEAAKVRAQTAEAEAVTQRDAATREAWNARYLVTGNLARDTQANAQAEAALALMLARRIHPDLAPDGGTATAALAQQLWARFALAGRPPAPRWSVDVGSPVRGVRLVDGGVLVVPASGALVVLDDAGERRCALAKLDGAELPPDLHWSKDDDGTVRAFSASGTRAVHLLAKPGEDAVLRIWDLATGGKLRTWKRPDLEAVALSDDDLHVVVANGTEGAVLSVEEGRELLSFFWRNTGRWPDGRQASFTGLEVRGRLGADEAEEPRWDGRIQAGFTGKPTAATEHPEEPAERRLVAAHFSNRSSAPAEVVVEAAPAASIHPHWGLVAATSPLPLRLGPAPEAGLWSASRRGSDIEVVVARGATVTSWLLASGVQGQTLRGADGDLQYDEEPGSRGLVAWLSDGTCIMALDSSLLGEGYLFALDPATGASAWQTKIENAVGALAVTTDGTWLAVASMPVARTKGERNRALKPVVPPWLLRRQSDGQTWPLDRFLKATPTSVRFTATTLIATLADGTTMGIDVGGAEPTPAVPVTATAEAPQAWVTAIGGNSRDGVLAITGNGVALAHDGRALHLIHGLAHGWFAPDGRTLYDLAWDGRASIVRRIPLVPGDLPGQLPPLHGAEARWTAWAAAEPATAAEDGSCTVRALPAGIPP